MQDIKVHFVCNGNIFRSRMAELYAKSLHLPGMIFSSSGIISDQHYNTPDLSPLVVHLLESKGLQHSDSADRTQTTTEILAQQDIIIFMNSDVRRHARNLFIFNEAKATAWRVKDWGDSGGVATSLQTNKAAHFADMTFNHIKRAVDHFIHSVNAHAWVDVRSADDQPLGFRLPITWVNKNKNVWHQGIHVVVTTPSGYVVEKRSADIVFSPNLLEVTIGGGVDSGEMPVEAAQREIHEELGIVIHQHQLRLIEVSKWVSYHPRYRRYSRVHLSTYHLHLSADPTFTVQLSEVAEARIITLRQLRRLLLARSIRGFGRLVYSYKYYNRIIKLVEIGKETY